MGLLGVMADHLVDLLSTAVQADLHNRSQHQPVVLPNQPVHHTHHMHHMHHNSLQLLHPNINLNKQLLPPNIKPSMQPLQQVPNNNHNQLLVWIQPKLHNNSNNTCSIISMLWHIGNSTKQQEANPGLLHLLHNKL